MSNLVIALDFDGTLCHDNLFPSIGKPRMWLIEKAIYWRRLGHKVILWTCRENIHPDDYSPTWPFGMYLRDAVEWCKNLGLEFDAINMNISEVNDPTAKCSRKIFADVYIDDKSIILYESGQMLIGMNNEEFYF
jgi:hypothetical protein